MSDWGALQAQVVWFTGAASSLSASKVFEAVTGISPENTSTTRAPFPGAPSASAADGRFRQYSTNVSVTPTRIDVLWNPSEFIPFAHPDASVLLDDVRNLALEASSALSLASVNRLAMVLNVGKVMPSDLESARYANHLVDSALPFDDFGDFLLQVSRRTTSGAGRPLNRLLRYGVTSGQMIAQDATGSHVELGSTSMVGRVIDVNTVPILESYSVPDQIDIFRELGAEVSRLLDAPNIAELEK